MVSVGKSRTDDNLQERKDKEKEQNNEKNLQVGYSREAIQSFEDQMPYFLQHVYVKRQQSAFFDAKKANLTQSEALVQVDFAECKVLTGTNNKLPFLLSQF